ncbi:C1 family peptidase [Aspergillus lucknowensis]|uniref:Cysteine proteinase 1, mitochondrial n=1 Tax=Aspergillus lucknowensis TaxID=176173 RepID=A0ABR4LL40_9EURO
MGTSYSQPVRPLDEKSARAKRNTTDPSPADRRIEKHETESPPPYQAEEPEPTVSLRRLQDWNETLLGDPKNRLAISSLASASYTDVLANRSAIQSDTQIFSLKIPIEGSPITNQRSSGRCWLFASTNIFRVPIIKAYGLSDFELSQAYLFYWDKIEKANWFFETIIETADEDVSSRLVQKLLEDPVTDGGQWDMVANLVKKYGLVPHDVYPDNFNAQNSSKMNWLLTAKLREHAFVLRKLARSPHPKDRAQLAESKENFLKEIHSLVTLLLGPPPNPDEPFVWQYNNAEGKAREIRQTPLEFGRQAFSQSSNSKVSPTRLYSLVNDPRNEYHRLLTVDKLGNVKEGQPLTYVNVEMKILKNAVISMLKAGHPVFFGCDVGKFSDRVSGVMDPDVVDLSLGFNVTLGLNKAERLASGESAMTHAMVITAVHIENGHPVRWRVENSWGEGSGDKGWYVMTDRWMDEYTFQAVVDFNFVSKEVRDILRQSPKVLPRWDPLGVLA